MPRRTQETTPQETPKALLIGVIGIGETTSEIAEALLTDLTAPYEEVALVVAAADQFWSTTTDDIMDWSEQNNIGYSALTDGEPAKDFVSVLEDASETVKAARLPIKMAQLLAEAKTENDVVLLVLGNTQDPEDPEAEVAVNKALELGVKTLDLLNGLEEFEFDEEGQDDSVDHAALDAKRVGDDYDDLGVRALRAKLREHPNKIDSDRAIGQLNKDDAIAALRRADQAQAQGDAPEEVVQEQDDPKAESTRRARRAFAEGAAEGTGDEAQSLPRSRGADVIVDQDDELDSDGGPAVLNESAATHPVASTDGASHEDEILRLEALRLAVQSGASGTEVIPTAERFAIYLRGERKAPGRPRADGSPAQRREINPETGKPVRRRPGRDSTD